MHVSVGDFLVELTLLTGEQDFFGGATTLWIMVSSSFIMACLRVLGKKTTERRPNGRFA